jgi:hypothetical protein
MSFNEIQKKNKEAINLLDDDKIRQFADEVNKLVEKIATRSKLKVITFEQKQRINRVHQKYQDALSLEEQFYMFKRLEIMKKYMEMELKIIDHPEEVSVIR